MQCASYHGIDQTLMIVDRFVTAGSAFVTVGVPVGLASKIIAQRHAHVVSVQSNFVEEADNDRIDLTVFVGTLHEITGVIDDTDIPCLTFPDLFDLYDIDDCSLVKLDVQGAECIILEHAAPFLADLGIPLIVAMHEPWWSRPVERSWFDGYSTIEGELKGWHTVLALP